MEALWRADPFTFSRIVSWRNFGSSRRTPSCFGRSVKMLTSFAWNRMQREWESYDQGERHVSAFRGRKRSSIPPLIYKRRQVLTLGKFVIDSFGPIRAPRGQHPHIVFLLLCLLTYTRTLSFIRRNIWRRSRVLNRGGLTIN